MLFVFNVLIAFGLASALRLQSKKVPGEQELQRGGFPGIDDYVVVDGYQQYVSAEEGPILERTDANNGTFSVVLQLPHDLNLKDECQLHRIAHAKRSLPTNYNLVCFWWTDNGQHVDSTSADVKNLKKTCDGKLIIYHRDVLPQFAKHGLKIHAWWNSDVPFVLTAQQYKDSYFKNSNGIWYLEWDVHWQGGLGSMLQALAPNPNNYGYGIFKHSHVDCSTHAGAKWHECRSPAKPKPTFIDYKKVPHGLIQMVWYHPRLLDNMFQHVLKKEIPYCEAFAASLCESSAGCKIYDYGGKGKALFDYWHWKPFTGKMKEMKEIKPGHPGLFYHPIKQCPAAAYRTQ